ncbi:MAG: YWFCY domain-containing protein, partial [Cyclobacteriaceae bacterium]
MEQKRQLEKLHGLIQFLVYGMVFLEIFLFIYSPKLLQEPGMAGQLVPLVDRLVQLPVYQNLLYSKLAILLAICLAAVGTLSKKELDLNPKKQIVFPLILGFILFFGSLYFYAMEGGTLILPFTSW